MICWDGVGVEFCSKSIVCLSGTVIVPGTSATIAAGITHGTEVFNIVTHYPETFRANELKLRVGNEGI